MDRYEVFSKAKSTDSASVDAYVLDNHRTENYTSEKRMQPLVADYQRGPVPTKVSTPLLMSKEASAKVSTPSLLPSPSKGPLQLARATKHWSSSEQTIKLIKSLGAKGSVLGLTEFTCRSLLITPTDNPNN